MGNIVGDSIIKYRKLNGITQKYLAARIGISVQGLLKIEKGMTNPTSKTIKNIVDALCITPNQLFGVEEITENNSDILKVIRKNNEEMVLEQKD